MASMFGCPLRCICFLSLVWLKISLSGAQIPQWDNIARFKPTGSYPAAWKKAAETYYAYWAVDGDRDPDDVYRRSCFITTSSEYGFAFFWIDLGKEHDISEVILVNRKLQAVAKNQIGPVDVLKNFKILVTDQLQSHTKDQDQFFASNNFSVCATQGEQSLSPGEVKQYPCEATCRGRYVVIAKMAPKDEQFPLCEVEVYDQNSMPNVALKKPTAMFTQYKGHQKNGFKVSWKGNDGLHMYLDADGTCVHSSNAGNIDTEYWMVDLLRSYRVRRIVAVNRGDRNTGGYFRKFKFTVLKDVQPWVLNLNDYYVCYQQTTFLQDAEIIDANCGYEAVGRHVMLYKYDAKSNALLLCEMEIYATPVVDENIALNKPTEMSGEIGKSIKTSGKAVDGMVERKWGAGSCIRTPGTATTEWWAVDLLDLYKIRNVVVVNRGEEASCFQFMGVSLAMMKVKDAQITVSSHLNKWTKLKGRLWNWEMTYGTDSWCPKTKAATEYFQVDFINTVLLTGFTMQGGYYTYTYEVYIAYSEDGKTFKYLMDATGKNKLVLPGTPLYFYYMRSTWFPKPIHAKKIRIHPVKYSRWPCMRVDFHGCYNIENNFKNVKIKTVRTMDEYHTKSSSVKTCHDQTASFPKGYLRPLKCKDRPLGRYVIVEKTAAKQKLEMCEFEVYGDRHDGNLAYGKPTKQSSTYWKWDSKLAVDGNRASNMTRHLSCSQTLSKPGSSCTASGYNWWMVDMEKSYEIGRVTVVSHAGCCGDCLQKFQILLTDTFNDTNMNISKYRHCQYHEGKLEAGQIKTVMCNPGARGRYLLIYAPSSYPLTLCEVEVFERFQFGHNLALGKPTDQSSDKDLRRGHSNLAVDGIRTTDYKLGSCTMTGGKMEDAWWHVDLLAEYRIRKIVVVNRGDALANRLRNFKVAITKIHRPFELSKVPSALCHSQSAPLADSEVKVMFCTNRPIGRHVTIIKSQALAEPLTLCEVEVYGTLNENNLAWMKPTSQSSNLPDPNHKKAVDGKISPRYFDGSCSTTLKNAAEQWWRVDLGKVYDVDRVLITNRADCCANYLHSYRLKLYEVWNPFQPLSNPHRLCSDRRDIKYTGGDIIQVKCNKWSWGRYLAIWKTKTLGEPLVLCEVEVYGRERMTIPTPPTNLAKGKATLQSAAVKHSVATSGVVVDGKSDLGDPNKQCTKTSGTQTTEWVMVDLGKITNVTKVSMVMGPDCCDKQQKLTAALMDTFDPEELNKVFSNAYINSATSPTTSPSSSTMVDTCGSHQGLISKGQWLGIECAPGTLGRYLYILKSPAKGEPLSLCEIMAFSDPPPKTTSRRKRDLDGLRLPSFLANAGGMTDFLTLE